MSPPRELQEYRPRASKQDPSANDPRKAEADRIIQDLAHVYGSIDKTKNFGEYAWIRARIYDIIKAQGNEGAILNELNCPVCYDRFNKSTRKPTVNSCGHTFCNTCFNRQWPRNECPMCNKLKTQGALNVALLSIVEKVSTRDTHGGTRVRKSHTSSRY
jgi:hypothetical protein